MRGFYDAGDVLSFAALAFASGALLAETHFPHALIVFVALIWVSVIGYLLRPVKV